MSEAMTLSIARRRGEGQVIKGRPKQVPIPCKFCGAEFYRYYGGQLFCKMRCVHDHQLMNGLNYRKKALKWLPHICERCQLPKELRQIFVHHRDEDRTNNALSNLAIMCTKCHWQMHPNASLISRRAESSAKAVRRGIQHIVKGLKMDPFGAQAAAMQAAVLAAVNGSFDGEEIKAVTELKRGWLREAYECGLKLRDLIKAVDDLAAAMKIDPLDAADIMEALTRKQSQAETKTDATPAIGEPATKSIM